MDLRDVTEFIKDTLKYIVVIAVVFIVALFVFSFQQVIGPSMDTTLHEKDVVIINKLALKFRELKRGDIVILSENEKYMVKRIIGLPGETVEYKEGKLYINGEPYNEKYTSSDTVDFDIVEVPENKYFVLGDNRADSLDSRDYGCVDIKDIIGLANFRIYPFNKIGSIK